MEIVGEVSGDEPPQPIPQNRRRNFNTPHNHFSGCEAEMEHPANVRDITPQEENFLRQLYENPEPSIGATTNLRHRILHYWRL